MIDKLLVKFTLAVLCAKQMFPASRERDVFPGLSRKYFARVLCTNTTLYIYPCTKTVRG